MTPDASKILEALPPQWQTTAILVIVALHLVVQACQFAANHGGIRGIAGAVWNGKKPTP